MIMQTMYDPTVEGLCGNDDAGQMSAWYILSALGFYSVTPGSSNYALGSPLVKEAMITFPNGKTTKIVARNQSTKNIYVLSVTVNGKKVENNTLTHKELTSGGEIIFEMAPSAPKSKHLK